MVTLAFLAPTPFLFSKKNTCILNDFRSSHRISHIPSFTVSQRNHAFNLIRASVSVDDKITQVAPPRPLNTTVHTYTDPRGHQWTYEADVLSHAPPTPATQTSSPVVFAHTPSGLGTNRTYWDPLLSSLSAHPNVFSNHSVARFDWVGTGETHPKPHSVAQPYDASYFAAQLAHFASTFGQKIVLVAQGASEPVAIRFATEYPHLIKAYVISTGLSTKYITSEQNESRRNTSYAFFTSLAGRVFWQFVATRRFITGFSIKNLLATETFLEEWVSRSIAGSRDPKIRFNVYSFLSGFLFGDYSEDLLNIQVPTLFLAGTENSTRSIKSLIKSVRPPVPLVATEKAFTEKIVQRMEHRCANIPNCQGVVVNGVGFQMFFEHADDTLPPLEKFLRSLDE